MRRISAIVLLVCFTLYHFGYYVAYFSFHVHMEQHWREKIYSQDNENLEGRLLEIPMTIPYMADEEDFRASNTLFEKDGQFFRAIKQRYANDTLQIIYVPDTAKRNLDHTIKQWVSSLVQDELPEGGQSSLLSKIFLKDYIQPTNDSFLACDITEDKQFIGFIFSAYQHLFQEVNSPPPQYV